MRQRGRGTYHNYFLLQEGYLGLEWIFWDGFQPKIVYDQLLIKFQNHTPMKGPGGYNLEKAKIQI